MRPERFCAPIHWGKQILLKILGTVICNNSKSILFSFFSNIFAQKFQQMIMYIRTCWQGEHFGFWFFKKISKGDLTMSPLILCCEMWSLVCFASSPCFLVKAIARLSNLKATIILCFKIWIFLFVLTLFNILHSFLVTVVYRLQDKGKPLGLPCAQAIEVFKHQLVLVDSGISWKRNV